MWMYPCTGRVLDIIQNPREPIEIPKDSLKYAQP
jgi:hypothetical protein